jgi:RNA 3'-terminal phosphate cyclase (ATP)
MAEDTPDLLIDGSTGEGGGQVLRTSLSLSIVTRIPFRMVRIRAHRPKAGLRPQHLAAVRAAAAVSGAEVQGAEPGSGELRFRPGGTMPGDYRFDIGTAGSTGLVLQTILPALVTAPGPSRVVLCGGTHNPMAPSFEFLEKAFVPLLNRMGPEVRMRLLRHGFQPAGGGEVEVTVAPCAALRPLVLMDRGARIGLRVTAIVARLPRHIAEREIERLRSALEPPPDDCILREAPESAGPGNAVVVEAAFSHVTEVFTAFGARGVPAEEVAARVAREARDYLSLEAPVGRRLADQLILPLALAGSGAFRTGTLSLHARTNLLVIGLFLPGAIEALEEPGGTVLVRGRPRP